MKALIRIMLLLMSAPSIAQRLNGVVYNNTTLLPVANATVTTSSFSAVTSVGGKFSLNYSNPGEVLVISSIGYKTYTSNIYIGHTDTLRIYLEPAVTQLKEVLIKGTHNYQLDSIKNRKQFASIFAYRAPAFKDVFVAKSANVYTPFNNITAPNNTTNIVSVNLLSLISILNKNNAPASRLQKVMLKDEQENYVDHVFAKSTVSGITAMKGDSLIDFMDRYRPTAEKLKVMTDYDFITYIKTSYAEFIRTYKHQNR